MTRVKRGVISLKEDEISLNKLRVFATAENPKKEWPEKLCFTPDYIAFTTGEKKKRNIESFVASKDKRRFQGQRNFLQQTDKQIHKGECQAGQKNSFSTCRIPTKHFLKNSSGS